MKTQGIKCSELSQVLHPPRGLERPRLKGPGGLHTLRCAHVHVAEPRDTPKLLTHRPLG